MKTDSNVRPLFFLIVLSTLTVSLLWIFLNSEETDAADLGEDNKSISSLFDFSYGEEGKKCLLRLPNSVDTVRALVYTHQNMTEEVLFRSKRFTDKMDSLGVAMAFIQGGSKNWDTKEGCQERFDSIINKFVEISGHSELSEVPIIPFGHSAQATFPWNFAAWNPDKTLCVISYHGDSPRTNLCGYGGENIEWGRERNIDSIPGLMIMGEYEWWDARLRPALAFKMMYPESRISFLCDAGKGHFDLCEETQDYIAKFIEKSLLNPRPKDGVYYSKWNEDGSETDNFHEQFWYFDDEMVKLTKQRYEETRGKHSQYVSAKINGQLLSYNPESHIKIVLDSQEKNLTFEPVFVDETRSYESPYHADVKPKITLISGPAIQTGEYSFVYDPDYFGFDPNRLWSGITLCIEAEGDSEYKSAVQELNIQINER